MNLRLFYAIKNLLMTAVACHVLIAQSLIVTKASSLAHVVVRVNRDGNRRERVCLLWVCCVGVVLGSARTKTRPAHERRQTTH